MSQHFVYVLFLVHGTDERNAEDRLAQRLEVARLVRPAGTPPEPGMIESWQVAVRPDLHEKSLDTPAALVRKQTGDPLVEALEHETSTTDVSMVRPERSGEPPPSVTEVD